MHVRDVLNVDGRAVRGVDDDILDICYGLDEAQAPHNRPLSGLLDDVAAHVSVRALNGLDNR